MRKLGKGIYQKDSFLPLAAFKPDRESGVHPINSTLTAQPTGKMAGKGSKNLVRRGELIAMGKLFIVTEVLDYSFHLNNIKSF